MIIRYKINDVLYEREATPEELAAMQSEPEPEPSAEERLAALEEELRAAKILLGVEV